MRTLRIVLQLVIAVFFVLALVALLRPPFSLAAFVGVTAFFAFLFLLTLMLREHTESRLTPSRTINPKVLGSFLVSPGVGLIWFSWRIATGQQVSSGWRGQRLATVIEFIGPWIPAAVFLVSLPK